VDSELWKRYLHPKFWPIDEEGGPDSDANDDGFVRPIENKCGICSKSPPAHPVVLPNCRHCFCLVCAVHRGVEVSFGTKCFTCSDRQADVSCFTLFEKNYVEKCAENSEYRYLDSRGRSVFHRKALSGCETAIEELSKPLPSSSVDVPRCLVRFATMLAYLALTGAGAESSDERSLAVFAKRLEDSVEKMQDAVKDELSQFNTQGGSENDPHLAK